MVFPFGLAISLGYAQELFIYQKTLLTIIVLKINLYHALVC